MVSVRQNQTYIFEAFNSRCLDDLLNIDNPYFIQMEGHIYTTELHLCLVHTNSALMAL